MSACTFSPSHTLRKFLLISYPPFLNSYILRKKNFPLTNSTFLSIMSIYITTLSIQMLTAYHLKVKSITVIQFSGCFI